MDFCENDAVLSIITKQLKNIDAHIDEWLEEGQKTRGGSLSGSGQFQLPTDETERDALLYQFSLKINSGQIDLATFHLQFFGSGNYNEMVYAFNDAIIRPLERSITYKLEEIAYEVNKQYDEYQEIPIKIFYVYQDYSTNISGDAKIEGDGVIGAGSTIDKTKSEDKSITINGNARIQGDGIIGNENILIKKFINKKALGIIAIVSFIAALIAIYSFLIQ